MKRFVLAVLLAAPALGHADSSKEPASAPARKLAREWQVDSRLFAADKDAPELRKGGDGVERRQSPKLK